MAENKEYSSWHRRAEKRDINQKLQRALIFGWKKPSTRYTQLPEGTSVTENCLPKAPIVSLRWYRELVCPDILEIERAA